MSETTQRQCDHCGNETDNYMSRPGWIQIRGYQSTMVVIRVTQNRKNARPLSHNKCWDFCDIDCFNDWIGKFLPEEETNGEATEEEGNGTD